MTYTQSICIQYEVISSRLQFKNDIHLSYKENMQYYCFWSLDCGENEVLLFKSDNTNRKIIVILEKTNDETP